MVFFTTTILTAKNDARLLNFNTFTIFTAAAKTNYAKGNIPKNVPKNIYVKKANGVSNFTQNLP